MAKQKSKKEHELTNYADGFFGRPRIGHYTIMLKPLPKTRKGSLSKELKKIGSIHDKRENPIELRA